MSCILGVACLYLDLAIGVHKETDADLYVRNEYTEVRDSTLGPIHETGVNHVYIGNAEEVTRPNPLGRVKLGVEAEYGSTTWYFELEHHSSMNTSKDDGFNGAWLGSRVHF